MSGRMDGTHGHAAAMGGSNEQRARVCHGGHARFRENAHVVAFQQRGEQGSRPRAPYARSIPRSRSRASASGDRTPRGSGARISRSRRRTCRACGCGGARRREPRRPAACLPKAKQAAGKGWPNAIRERRTLRREDRGKGDQGQAHEAGRILAAQARKQADAEPLALRAAGAVEGVLALEVAFDLDVGEAAKGHVGAHQALVAALEARIPDAQRGVEEHRMAAHVAQLGAGAIECPGLADGAAVKVGDLIRADNPGTGKLPRRGLGLGAGEADRGFARRLGPQRLLVDAGDQDSNGNPRRWSNSRRSTSRRQVRLN